MSSIFNFQRKVFLKVPPIFNQIFNMQVENTIQNKQSPIDSENSGDKENPCCQNKQLRAENRIARYQQKPERKASKMLVRLLQWADKLVIKFFTKKLLPNELQIFFNREARANKVQLKKAQIDYSVEDFAVRLYVFWVCQSYFEKANYEENLSKLLLELRDELNRKKKNLSESLEMCGEESQKKQKQQELKWMGAIINGLNTFNYRYSALLGEQDIIQFLLEITSNIMIECLRKPGNKLAKKKEKLKVKIKYFQQKIAQILGNSEIKSMYQDREKKVNKIIHKNTIIISPGLFPIEGLTRTNSNTSAFQKYRSQQKVTMIKQVSKKQDFEVKLEYPKRNQMTKNEQINHEIQMQKSNQKTSLSEQINSKSALTSEVKMDEQVSDSPSVESNSDSSLSV